MISAVILGVVQGVTEFLPISSSGHLIVLRELLGLDLSGSLGFDAVLQLATSFAVLVYFWRDLVLIVRERNEKNRMLSWAIVVGTIPAVIAGFFLENVLDSFFRNSHLVAWALIGGSVLFLLAERHFATQKDIPRGITLKRGLFVGLFQMLALVPGISRSGATISGGLLAGFTREDAIRFSFLLSLPILLGSGLKKLFDLGGSGGVSAELVVGSLVAFVVGLASIHFLIRYLRRRTLHAFVVYRVALAVFILLFL